MPATAILGGAPPWVWLVLAGLIVLGVRRLRTRRAPVAVALLPLLAFGGWGLTGAYGFASLGGAGAAALVWAGGAATGALSAILLPEARATRFPGGIVSQPGSPVPLALYLTVFVVRFGCGAWAAIVPEQVITAMGLGVAVSAAMTGRLLANVLRWRPPAV